MNTELRELKDARVFDHVDFVTLDGGERPLLSLIEHLHGQRSAQRLQRTFIKNDAGHVQYINLQEPDIPFEEVGTATWDGLPLHKYLSLLDMLNPMHRLWSDGRWNKLTVAHGCYWKKCSFCDVSLDYISRYEGASAEVLADRIEQIVRETGQTGFHFVDEAAPPKVLRALAEELLRRGVQISWWGNIRFEKTFTPELCQLLADSGCIAISGGLEVASDRLLQLMTKGVSVEQVARVTRAFADAGKPGLHNVIEVKILDHGYTEKIRKTGKPVDWFGTNGDVFAVGVEMKPFPPLSPNGSRSFPRKHLAKGHGQWNHYYIRAINGEVRLWVNGEEVSGGNGCDPAKGFLCLESEGSPIRFRKLRLRELP